MCSPLFLSSNSSISTSGSKQSSLRNLLKCYFLTRTGWIDVSNLKARAPFYKGAIYAKIILSQTPCSKIFTKQALQGIITSTSATKPAPKPTSKQIQLFQISPSLTTTKKQDPAKFKVKQRYTKEEVSKMEQQQIDKACNDKTQEIKNIWIAEETKKQEMVNHRQAVEIKVNAWAYQGATRNNIRTLISTLHTILWQDAAWSPVSLSEVMSEDALKSKIRAAKLLVHPDKNRGVDTYRLCLSGSIFNVLKEALKDQ